MARLKPCTPKDGYTPPGVAQADEGLKSQDLRDHMTEAELIFTALAELSTRQIAESVEATGMHQNGKAAQEGRRIAKRARLSLEEKTGQKVVSKENYLPLVRGSKQLIELPLGTHVREAGHGAPGDLS